MLKKTFLTLLFVLLLISCSPSQPIPSPTIPATPLSAIATNTPPPTATNTPTAVPPTATSLPSSTPTQTPIPTITPTADPSQPILLAPNIISTDDEEWRITFAPDGQSAYFARTAGFSPQSPGTIMVSQLQNGIWLAPEIAPFSGQWNDTDPFITPDGRQLYFSSTRPINGEQKNDFDNWVVNWDGTNWSDPIHLAALNSPKDDLYLSATSNGVLYFGSNRSGGVGGWDIYRAVPDADGQYTLIENVGEPVNTPSWEFNPTISADGTLLIFTGLSYSQGRGLGDIYFARLSDEGWTTVRSIGSRVNSTADEYHPSLSPDGQHLYFVRRSIQGDIYTIPLSYLAP